MKYQCPHCKSELNDNDVMSSKCSKCLKMFTKALPVDLTNDFQTPVPPNKVSCDTKSNKVDLTEDFETPVARETGKTCPYCQAPIKPGIPVVTCPVCQIPHHQECWNENKGCTTYGCDYVNKRMLSEPQSAAMNTQRMEEEISRPLGHGRKTAGILIAFVILGIVITGTIGVMKSLGNHELQTKLNSLSSKNGISAKVYYESFPEKNTIIFDFLGVNGSNARRIDPIHLVLQFGEEITAVNYEVLVLANNRKKVFMITKTGLSELSYEYKYGNPLWSIIHLPERLTLPDGTPAFSTWTGGILGVITRQTEDLESVIVQWLEK